MSSAFAALIIITAILAIDFSMRFALKHSDETAVFKSPSLVALLIIALLHGKRRLIVKSTVKKQFLLSVLVVVFLVIANYFLLLNGISEYARLVELGLILAPLFILPFFHFLYELLFIHPLSIDNILDDFHERGVLALILSANVIFLAIDQTRNVFSLTIHFILAFFAVLGLFYRTSNQRKKPSSFTISYRDHIDHLETSILRFLAAILELFYALLLLYFVFLKNPIEAFFAIKANLNILCLTVTLLLIMTTAIVKLRFYQSAPVTSAFYEQRALPLSFLLFGILTIFQNYV